LLILRFFSVAPQSAEFGGQIPTRDIGAREQTIDLMVPVEGVEYIDLTHCKIRRSMKSSIYYTNKSTNLILVLGLWPGRKGQAAKVIARPPEV
jgi:hypothetical protein